MKNLMMFALSLLLSTTLAFAQGQPRQRGNGGQRPSVEQMAQRQTEWMTRELNLSADQIAAVDSINVLFAKAQETLRETLGNDRGKMREAMTALNQEKDKALEKVLTTEQLELYRKKAAEMFANRRRS
ncbi:MAG: hypothetical protein LBH19_07005 [Dysgonamonadaceae bacterium]|jgi:hypothetical protein|nr:hypothetical protein [Dysgonamonadaceae bacterium]